MFLVVNVVVVLGPPLVVTVDAQFLAVLVNVLQCRRCAVRAVPLPLCALRAVRHATRYSPDVAQSGSLYPRLFRCPSPLPQIAARRLAAPEARLVVGQFLAIDRHLVPVTRPGPSSARSTKAQHHVPEGRLGLNRQQRVPPVDAHK